MKMNVFETLKDVTTMGPEPQAETIEPSLREPRVSGNDLPRKISFADRVLQALGVLGALVLFLISLSLLLLLSVGRWLVHEDPLQKADAIVVLSGNFPMRAMEAAALYRSGYGREIWLTRPSSHPEVLKELGIQYPGEDKFNFLVLRRQGVPAKNIHILEDPIANTADELEAVGSTLDDTGEKSVIIVTDKTHTRRVRTMWNKFEAAHGSIIVHGVVDDEVDPATWWRTTEGTHQVLHEIMGMMNLYAGMPVQSSLHRQESVAENNADQKPPVRQTTAPSKTGNHVLEEE